VLVLLLGILLHARAPSLHFALDAVAVALGGVLAWLAARPRRQAATLHREVRLLVAAVRRRAAGDLAASLDMAGHDDVVALARAVDELTGAFLARQRDVEAALAATREGHETSRALVQASPLAVVALAADGTVTIWNRAAEELFGWREEEVVGRPDPLAPGPLSGESRRLLDRVLAGEHVRDMEAVRQAQDGRLVSVAVSAAPVQGSAPGVRRAVLIYTDMTERKRTEQQLAHQRDILFKSEKLAALGRLAAGVAHELRHPLTVIEVRVQMLEQQPASARDREPLATHLGHLAEAVGRMRRIMEGLSTYSRPERRHPAWLDVRELLSSARELVMHQARKSGVEVDVDVPLSVPRVLGDRSRMMQILVNLATNGVEAMSEWGGRLALRARLDTSVAAARTGARRVVVEIADTGPGIPADRVERIWDAFYTTKPEGTGLGLSIVRSLVEEQPDASISVESVPGAGTTFRLTLAIAAIEPAHDR
jgi:PAS domain S-box-containing protein